MNCKKLLSLLLAVCLSLTLIPTAAFAAAATEEETTPAVAAETNTHTRLLL